MFKISMFSLVVVGSLGACGKIQTAQVLSKAGVSSASSAAPGSTVDEVIAPPQSTPALQSASATYNFVAAYPGDCEAAISQRLGRSVQCTIGGGCSIDGFVPSASHPSANPSHYGACISGPATPAPAPSAPIQRRNVVAGDQSTCDTVVKQYSSTAQCTYGGGCALDGGLPTNSNPSANPAYYGACFAL